MAPAAGASVGGGSARASGQISNSAGGRTDGLAGQLFRFLTSLPGAIAAVVVLAVATGLGVGFTSGATAMARAEAGTIGRWAELFELSMPFTSWWFTLALWFAGLVGAANALAGLGKLFTSGARPQGAPLRLRATLHGDVHPDIARRALRTSGRVVEDDDGTLVAERGLYTRAAPLVAGLGALGVALGIGVVAHGGVSGFARVAEGGTVYGYDRITRGGLGRFDLGLELSVERAAPAKAGDAPGPLRVVLGRGAEILAERNVAFGEGFSFAGWRYSLDGAEAGDGPGRFLISEGGGVARSVAAGEPFKAEDGTELIVVGYEAGDPRTPVGARVPAVRVARGRPGQAPDVGWVYGGADDFDERVRRSTPALRLHGYERRQELRLRIEWAASRLPLLLGAGLLALGLLLFAGRPYARIEAEPTPLGWVLRAQSDSGAGPLGAELDALVATFKSRARQQAESSAQTGGGG